MHFPELMAGDAEDRGQLAALPLPVMLRLLSSDSLSTPSVGAATAAAPARLGLCGRQLPTSGARLAVWLYGCMAVARACKEPKSRLYGCMAA